MIIKIILLWILTPSCMCVLYFECSKNATLILVTGMALPVPLGLSHGKIALH